MPKPKLKHTFIRTSVFLTRAQHDALARVSATTDIPVARLVRRGVELLLAQYDETTTTKSR